MKYRTLAGAASTGLALLSASSAALATTCPAVPPGSYTSATVCTVGPFTFENFSSSLTINQGNADGDTVTVNGSVGSVTISQGSGIGDVISITGPGGNMSVFASGNEFGLAFPTTPPLYSSAITGDTGSVDLHWSFDVVGASIADAFLAFSTDITTGAGGSAQASVTETLNGTPLTLGAPGSTTLAFTPVTSLHVEIDEIDTQLGPSTVTFGGLTAAFSVPVPEPTTLALLGIGLTGLGLSRRRRN